ncbi:AbrB/MazE/SpoVT family DNA-binding domain-containing protein [Rhodoferax sp.]|uniref:AbrB/MazE/SpoVT family DNA-binding domain-containing protein n=1 Tax=Rhodoferax sp. TaxID=50421 RepID=UPI002746B877|nr:AbrB/MazE/SpoVT family DNA-binding domain-containing protein [Rhodoferax sp.]
MTTKLCVWGNSLGVRLPKYVVERTAVKAGDYLFITVTDGGEIVIRPVKPRGVHPGYGPVGKKAKTKSVVPTDAEVAEKW